MHPCACVRACVRACAYMHARTYIHPPSPACACVHVLSHQHPPHTHTHTCTLSYTDAPLQRQRAQYGDRQRAAARHLQAPRRICAGVPLPLHGGVDARCFLLVRLHTAHVGPRQVVNMASCCHRACLPTCPRLRVRTRKLADTRACMHACMRVHTHGAHVCMLACMLACRHVCLHACMHTCAASTRTPHAHIHDA